MDDHLDKTTTVCVELTETGVNAKAKSRFVAAVDRLGGNLVELVNAPMERRIARQRAVSAGEVKLIEAVIDFGIEKLKCDPEFAERTAEKFFKRVFEKQVNRDHVLFEALEDLRHSNTSDAEKVESGDISEEFLEKLEVYAEGASTETLRQKWGRVLSSEVKKPGTFSVKALRIVDEIEADTAALFETLCSNQIGGSLPRCLVGELPFYQITPLVTSGLMIDPGLAGHVRKFGLNTAHNGNQLWFFVEHDRAISLPKEITTEISEGSGDVLMIEDGVPAIPVYLMTDVGSAISTIFTKPESSGLSKYIDKLKLAYPKNPIIEYRHKSDGIFTPVS